MYFVVCAFLAIVTVGNCEKKRSTGDDVLDVLDLSKCEYQIEAIDCIEDFGGDRILPDEILNSRNANSEVYEEPALQWDNYNHWLANFICKCATKMMTMKNVSSDFIGIQYYAECWTNLNMHINNRNVNRKAKRTDCFDGDFKNYTLSRSNCQVYTGATLSNYIYRVSKMRNEENDCPFFTKRGCFKDTTPREHPEDKPLPEYVMNERDPSLPNWNSHSINWENWGDGYLNEMICRCAKKAKEMDKRFFGLQYYGECWVGDDELKIDQHGLADTCVDDKYQQTCSKEHIVGCKAKSCAGKALTNMVYELHQGPLGCLTNPCGAGGTCIPNGDSDHECVYPRVRARHHPLAIDFSKLFQS